MAAEQFSAVEVIRAKRDGGELSNEMIDWTIDAYTRGVIAEEQMSALNMAIYFQGMNRNEISRWTAAMINSGERMDFSALTDPSGKKLATTDKHSTGGVGDKITLPLAPLVASFGVAVPQLSGRGLGHTGGTLDKLEAIPAGRRICPTKSCSPSCPTSARSSAPPAPGWLRRTRSSTPCATSPLPWKPSR